jgi:ribonuclease Z
MKLLFYSKGLYSTWLYYAPDRIAFDAGEGMSSILGNKAFAIQHVFISHGHADHISGLIGLINIRNSGMGDTEKPLHIYYPKDNWRIVELTAYISRTNPRLDYELLWIPIEPGQKINLFEGQLDRYMMPFRTKHTRSEKSLGYNIIEDRRRLKSEYQGLGESEIGKLVQEKGREEITETYAQKLFSYSGDCAPLDPEDVRETEILCHEATFLDESDRENLTHSTLGEAVDVANMAGVKRDLYAFHISSRYRKELEDYQKQADKLGFEFNIHLVPPGKICRYE